MKVVLFFEAGNWEELEDRWEFRGGIGGLKSILVKEDISRRGLIEKIYAKLGLRYNITTTNMVESLNSMLVNARDFPYVALLDVIQEKMSKWWNDRRIVAMALTTPLTPSRESQLRPHFAQSNGRHTSQLNPVTYHVKGGELEGVVDIFNKTCTCKEFDIDKLPCVHAVAAAHHA